MLNMAMAPDAVDTTPAGAPAEDENLHRLVAVLTAGAADNSAAIEAVMAHLLAREPITDILVLRVLRAGVRQIVRDAQKDIRTSIEERGHYELPTAAARRAGRVIDMTLRGYSWPLPGGRAIGDATLEDLAAARAHYEGAAQRATRAAAMLAEIEKRMKKVKAARVRDCITEAALAALQQKIRHD